MPEQGSERSIASNFADQQQALLDFAISQSSAVFYIADLAGARPVRFIGENIQRLTGHAPEAFLHEVGFGRGLMHPDDLPVYTRRIEQLMERGSLVHEYRFRCAEGEYRWFRDEQRVVPGEDGEADEFIGCMTDITDRIEAEQESRRLARLLRHAVESIPNGFAIYDPAERLALCNTAFAEKLDATPDELDGRTAIDNTRNLLGRLKAIDGKPVTDAEASLPGAMTRWRESEREPIELELTGGGWFQVTSHPIPDGGRVVVQTDITRLKQAEAGLRDSEEQFRSIVEANPSPVRVSAFDTWEILYESPAAAALFGHPWPARDGRTTSPNYVDMAERDWVIETLHNDRRLDNHEILMRRADGSTFWVSLSCRVVRYLGKDVCVSSLVDLTETKNREAELSQARETLDDAIEALYEGLALFDGKDRLVLCNARFRELNDPCGDLLVPGTTWEELMRRRAEAGLFVEAQGRIDAWIEERRARRGRATEDVLALDGERWIQVSHRRTRQGGVVHTWRDITESRRMEEELREGEERVRSVLEGCPLPVRMWRLESHDVIYESPASRALFGRDATKLTPDERMTVYVDPEDRDPYLQKLRETGSVDHVEMHLRRADGSRFWGSVSARLIDYRGEKVVVSTIVDLSDRRLMEEALRESEQHFRALFEEHPLPLWMIETTSGKILHESPAAAALTGRTWEPGVRSVLDFWSDVNERGTFLRELYKKGELLNFEVALRRADGSVIPVSTHSRLIERGGKQLHVTALVDLREQRQHEAELRQARETLEDAIESLPEGFALFDSDDRLLLCNAKFRDFNHLTADLLYPGVKWHDFIKAGAERGQYVDAIGREEEWIEDRFDRSSLGTGEPRGVEFMQSDGRWFHAFSQRTRQGGYVGIRIDITESKKLELALRESEELVRQILEASPVPISMVRLSDSKILYESPAAMRVFGDKPGGVDRYATDSWVDLSERTRLIAKLREEGTLENAEALFRRYDGSTFWGTLSGRVIPYHDEEVAVTSVYDLTERRQMEEALRDNEEMVRRVLEACPVPVTMNRAEDGVIIYESPSARALLRYDQPREGQTVVSRWTRPEDRPIYLERLRKTGAIDDMELRYRKEDGELFWCSMSSRLIDYRGEEVIVSSMLDLTDRLAAEAELSEQREKLHQSEKLSALGELLAGVSHELNNPLSVLVGQALMLKEAAKDEAMAARADRISNAADRCARIVKTFLAMARQEPSRTVPTDLNALIEGALDMTAYGLRTSSIALATELDDCLPRVAADPDQLRQVFTNLIVNAQHALQGIEGARELRILTRSAKGQVEVRVEDNGPGIPEDIRGRIFEPLYTTKAVGSGTGIGLALCHRIVHAHGGTISVECPPGRGAQFSVVLPALSGETAAEAADAEGRAGAKAYRVLVIDDEIEVGEIISEVLEIDGHAVDVVSSGAEALELLAKDAYDVVLSDIRMPGMDGPTFYRRLTQELPHRLSSLAFITGDTLSPQVKSFLDECGRPYLEKPILPRDVRELVALLMRGGNGCAPESPET